MKKVIILIPLLVVGFFYCKQPTELQLVKFAGYAQGTTYAVTYWDRQGRNLQQDIDSLLAEFDRSVSTYQPASLISRINQNDQDVVPDRVFRDIFIRAMEIAEKTAGAFDVTVAPLVNAWGFGFTNRMKVDSLVVDSLLDYVGFRKINLYGDKIVKDHPGIMIDFNAIAQGYSVDLVGEFLTDKGIDRWLVDIGGEVLARGCKPGGRKWTVGIEKPAENQWDVRSLNAIVELEDAALATSGSYRKFYEENGIKYSHTINPATGYPVSHSLLSASVLAGDCCTADAYATAFMVMGVDRTRQFLNENPGLGVYLIYVDSSGTMQTYISQGLNELVLQE